MQARRVEIEKVVEFIVPGLVPPSVNRYKEGCIYTGRDGYLHRGYKRSKATRAYYDAVAIFARGRTVSPETDTERRKVRYAVRIDVYIPQHSHVDFDNCWKCGMDALENCGLIHNDSHVDGERSNVIIHKDDRLNPRTEYRVERLEEPLATEGI